MKVKVLHRDPSEFTITKPGGIQKYQRNADPVLHPFDRATEYTRALNGAKIQKMFAKPFLCALEGHTDAVKCMTRCRTVIAPLFTGSCDGEIRFWNVGQRRCFKAVRAHEGFVRGLCTTSDDSLVVSAGEDKTIKLWKFDPDEAVGEMLDEKFSTVGALQSGSSASLHNDKVAPLHVLTSSSMLSSIDAHWGKSSMLATAGETVDIWDYNRTTPLSTYEWGTEATLSVKFNPCEECLLGTTAMDNSIGLFDVRMQSGLRKVVLRNRSNAFCWNPRQPLRFSVANEDGNLYTFDMRKLDSAVFIHKGHVRAVLDLDYSPTGEELVSAGYDKTIRIFNYETQRSREVYHTKRMQRVLCCQYSGDGRFVFSGSEDCNIRVWKNEASDKLGVVSKREKKAQAYRKKLVAKYKHMPEIRRIANHKHLPKAIKLRQDKMNIMDEAQKKKEVNRVKNSKPGSRPKVGEKQKPILRQLK
ncbi:protein SOF1, putative [Perkinsus marinus ATCC 50983]|uniref:DDB1- and CUL4-associated factor 13 n=2 Tax=Perkinsus marinus (strain ATCC 50983 / TXsc) TaxID=423536 RepID=C5KY07_PERM5|nr:protein SOF1, putative [Perkinsus marinus ATCC 50983]EER10614.1 protein SOF1, putative [Perkinsus marinus ATCC 50983]|eukprot:XP_002778819.1 protein SOF1, putative [Perkinsus marinus ATCC 50983]